MKCILELFQKYLLEETTTTFCVSPVSFIPSSIPLCPFFYIGLLFTLFNEVIHSTILLSSMRATCPSHAICHYISSCYNLVEAIIHEYSSVLSTFTNVLYIFLKMFGSNTRLRIRRNLSWSMPNCCKLILPRFCIESLLFLRLSL